jgi:hypothetical protein
MRALDPEMIEQPDEVHAELVVSAMIARLVALAMTAQVQGDHPVIVRQVGQNAGIDPGRFDGRGKAVNEHDRGPGALVDVADANTRRVEVAVLAERRTWRQQSEEEGACESLHGISSLYGRIPIS